VDSVVSRQQIVILSRETAAGDGLGPIGPRREILDGLARHNTAPECNGEDVLYGPGIRIELPPGDPVTQMLLTIVEDEIAWLVIMRLARELRWRLLDPVSGRELTPR